MRFGGAQLKRPAGVNGEDLHNRNSRQALELEWCELYDRRQQLRAEINAVVRSMDVLERRLADSLAKEGETPNE